MPQIPAFCDSCGTIFRSGLNVRAGVSHVHFEGNKAAPCPKCGGWGSVPDGVYNFLDGVVQILSAPEISKERWRRFALLIEQAKRENASAQEIHERVNNEVPQLSTLMSALPKTRPELYGFLTMLLIAIGVFMPHDAATVSEERAHEIMDQAIEESFGKSESDIERLASEVAAEANSTRSEK